LTSGLSVQCAPSRMLARLLVDLSDRHAAGSNTVSIANESDQVT